MAAGFPLGDDLYWDELGSYWGGFNIKAAPFYYEGTTNGEAGINQLSGLFWNSGLNGWTKENPTG